MLPADTGLWVYSAGMDFVGNDLRTVAIEGFTWDDCAQECYNDRACNAFIIATTTDASAIEVTCWLKTEKGNNIIYNSVRRDSGYIWQRRECHYILIISCLVSIFSTRTIILA